MKRKKGIKTLECIECKKKFSFHNRWVDKHAKKYNHYKFKEINKNDRIFNGYEQKNNKTNIKKS